MIIETDGIRIEADTEKEAIKLLRKEQRKQRAEKERLAVMESAAETEAKSRGFDVMKRLMSGDSIPRGWSVTRSRPAVVAECVRHGVQLLTVDDHDGAAYIHPKREVYAYGVEAVLENGSGWPMIIWLVQHIGEDSVPYAIAGRGEAIGLVSMPQSIRPSLFAKQAPEECQIAPSETVPA